MEAKRHYKIMVTGASGKYGHCAIDYIMRFDPQAEVYGLIHTPAKAKDLADKGVNIRYGNFLDKESLVKAFQVYLLRQSSGA